MSDSAIPRWLSIAKALVEIAAVFVAGYWTYVTFIRTERPALERNFKVEGALSWHATEDADVCMAELNLQVRNISKSKTRVVKVKRRAWFLDLPHITGAISFFDPFAAISGSPAYEAEYTNGPFTHDYPPDASVSQTLAWLIRKRPRTYTLFQVDFFEEGSAQSAVYYFNWNPTCGEQILPSQPRLKTPR